MHLLAPLSFTLALSATTFAAPLLENEDLSMVALQTPSRLELPAPLLGLVKRAGSSQPNPHKQTPPSGYRCGLQGQGLRFFLHAEVAAAVATATAALSKGQLGQGKYPHAYFNSDAIYWHQAPSVCNDPNRIASGAIQEYPIGWDGFHPGEHRIVFHVGKDALGHREILFCGLMTHQGAAKGKFIPCKLGHPPENTGCSPGQSSKGVQKRCEPDDQGCPEGQSKGEDGRCASKNANDGNSQPEGDCGEGQSKGPDGKCAPKNPHDANSPPEINCGEGQSKGPDGKCVVAQPKDEDRKAEGDNKNPPAKDNNNNKVDEEKKAKVGRMGKCIGLVSMAMPIELANTYTSGFFSDDVLADEELMQFWPSDLPFDPSVDAKFEDDAFIDRYADSMVTTMDAQQREKFKTIMRRSDETESSDSVDDVSTEQHLEKPLVKRVVPLLAGLLIRFFIHMGTRVARAAATAGSRARSVFNIVGKGAGKPKGEQLAAIRDVITKDHKWVECLTGVLTVASQFA